jgi:phage terminase large subunit-like protein
MTYIPHCFLILDIIFNPSKYKLGKISEVIYSAPKKSIKTSITALVARWVAETWGGEQQLFAVANDQEQARGRLYQTFLTSLEQSPNWDRQKRTLRDLDGNPIWRIIERDSKHIPTGSVLKAISSDYKGEAGSNPTASFITEAWGITLERDKILYDELTVPPTRPRGFRWLDSYAGYIGVSKLLKERWEDCTIRGQRLTREQVPQWPFEGDLPLFYNEVTQHFGYVDTGVEARRMPWQVGPDAEAYYAKEYASLRPEAYTRLHLNEWVGDADSFIPIELWDNCTDDRVKPLLPGDRTPLVVGVDASVSSDCTGLVAVSRHPTLHREVALRLVKKFDPPKGGKLDYGSTIEATLREWCANYNVTQVTYDAYQLHYLMSELRNQRVAWCQAFSQGIDRNRADKMLYDLIRDRQLHHDGTSQEMREHILNAAAQMAPKEDTKLRIVKKEAESKIDLVVALSMAASRCLFLNL